MHDQLRIGKAEKTSTRSRVDAHHLSGLPQDFLSEGVKRLGLASLFYAACYFFAYFGPLFTAWFLRGKVPPHAWGPSTLIAALAIGLALGMFALTRRSRLPAATVLNIGLGFEVVGALGIAMTNVYGSFPVWDPELLRQIHYIGIPWDCVWIVIYPVMAPNRPRRILAASLLAASMSPLAMVISKAAGATSPDVPWDFLMSYFLFTTYLCAIMAYTTSRIVMRYGIRLMRARELGQYQMVEVLGKGGMGEVWLARHRMLARPAAIKLIRPESLGGDPASRASLMRRFAREAKATAALRSVHTIGIYDYGHTSGGVFYYVMELLDGLDLDTFVERFGPVPPARVRHWLVQACHSLAEAHERGLVHRDIKPANLFVCRLGPDHDFIKVLDFGLVKTGVEIDGEATKLTQEGIAFGTPGYMAPEMAMGSGEADARSDIYALGCLGYFLLTGEPVFKGDSPLATVVKHIKDEPDPPSLRTEQPIHPDLERIILACLAKTPEERPQGVRELAEALEACEIETTWSSLEAMRWWEMHLPPELVTTPSGTEASGTNT